MKPDWKYAPEWAQWLAQDYYGAWFWYIERPDMLDKCWNYPIGYTSMMGVAYHDTSISTIWQSTLEQRPKTK